LVKITIGVALLLLIALVGYRQTFTRLRLPSGARLVYLTGTEFIAVGFALGGELIGLLDEDTIRRLTPLFSLGLGATGLIFGIQLDLRVLRRFPARFPLIAATQAIVTGIAVFVPFFFILGRLFELESTERWTAAAVLAATAVCTAQTSLALVDREFRLRGAGLIRLLRYVSSLDALVGVTILGLAFAWRHQSALFGFEAVIGLQWFFLSVCIGSAMGFLLRILTMVRCTEEELLIFVLGTVLLSSGISLYFELSPLFVNVLMGIVVANSPGSSERIFTLLARLEKPVYVVFLLLAGAVWQPGVAWGLLLAGVYWLLRISGKVAGGFAAARFDSGEEPSSPGLGFGLVAQGGMAVALVMNYYQLRPGSVTDVVVTIVLVGVIASELVAPTFAVRLLRRVGEIER